VTKIDVGAHIRARDLTTIRSEHANIPDPNHLVHLQFRRYAACPMCNLHLRSISARHHEITAAGVREVVVFHSTETEMRKYQDGLPFHTIADPKKKLYVEFGVEPPAVISLLHPRAMWALVRGLARRTGGLPARGENIIGRPADFLIGPDGRVLARKYGRHAFDQWSVDELLHLALVHTDTAR
jgi:peroxiredoxin